MDGKSKKNHDKQLFPTSLWVVYVAICLMRPIANVPVDLVSSLLSALLTIHENNNSTNNKMNLRREEQIKNRQ